MIHTVTPIRPLCANCVDPGKPADYYTEIDGRRYRVCRGCSDLGDPGDPGTGRGTSSSQTVKRLRSRILAIVPTLSDPTSSAIREALELEPMYGNAVRTQIIRLCHEHLLVKQGDRRPFRYYRPPSAAAEPMARAS